MCMAGHYFLDLFQVKSCLYRHTWEVDLPSEEMRLPRLVVPDFEQAPREKDVGVFLKKIALSRFDGRLPPEAGCALPLIIKTAKINIFKADSHVECGSNIVMPIKVQDSL